MSKHVKGTTIPTSGGSENTPKEETETMLENMKGQEILEAKLEDLAYIILKGFKEKESREIYAGMYLPKGARKSSQSIEIEYAVLEAVQWLCNHGLIAPKIKRHQTTNIHFITRKGRKKLKELKKLKEKQNV